MKNVMLDRVSRVWMAALAALMFASPAMAGRTLVTDYGPPYSSTPGCLLGEGCSPVDLGFTIDFGSGPVSQIYAYDDGVISFGSPITNTSSTTVDGFGVPVLVPGLIATDFDQRDPPPYNDANTLFRVVNSFDRSVANQLTVNYATRTVFGPGWRNVGGIEQNSVTIAKDPSSGLVTITFNYGYDFIYNADRFQNVYGREGGFVYGYNLGANTFSGLLDGPSSGLSFSFQSLAIPSPVPEPATWASMIAGFALVGWRMRRRAQAGLRTC